MIPKYSLRMSITEFSRGAVRCPKCRLPFDLGIEPPFIELSAVIADLCPNCDTHIVIDKTKRDSVTIEGYDDMEAADDRIYELSLS